LLGELEPLPDVVNEYRAAAIYHLQLMFAVDRFLEDAEDARLGITAVWLVLQWPSARGLSVSNIARQFGCSPAAAFASFGPVPEPAATSRLQPPAPRIFLIVESDGSIHTLIDAKQDNI
jgi:hypothetical protein